MKPTLWKYTSGEMRRRPGRTLLMLLGIVLGVGAIVAVTLTTDATRRSYRDMFENAAGKAALEIVAEGQGGFEASDADLAGLDGIRAAVPVIQAPAALTTADGNVLALVVGIDPDVDSAARDARVVEGSSLAEKDGLLLEAEFAKAHGYELGKTAKMTAFTKIELPVVGLLQKRGTASFNGGAVLLMRLSSARRLFAMTGERITSLQLVLSEGVDADTVEDKVRARLPEYLRVQAPAQRGRIAQDSTLSWDQALTSLSAVSLVAGAFVILNAFQMNLGERRRQLAILRALGATRRQVLGVLLGEAALLGSVGTLLGIGLGIVLAVGCTGIMEQTIGMRLPRLLLTPRPFVLAVLVGPGMALAATLLPARRASRRPPLDELFPHRTDREEPVRRWPSYVGLGCMAMMAVVVFVILKGWLPQAVSPAFIAASLCIALVGCVLVIPLILGPLVRTVCAFLRPVLGMEGNLAFRHLDRHRERTGLTVGALLIALVVSISMSNSLLAGVRHSFTWFERIIDADYIVRGVMPDIGVLAAPALDEKLADEIAAWPEVAHVDKCSFLVVNTPVGDKERPVLLIARTIDPVRPLPLVPDQGNEDDMRRGLLQGEVIIGTSLAHQLGLHVGDDLALSTRRGRRPFRVAGVVSEYTAGGITLYMEWNTARRAFGHEGVHAIMVSARPGQLSELDTRLKTLRTERGLYLQPNADMRAAIMRSIEGVVGFMWVLMSLVFVVASLGIVNTLTINVLEQTRELGVLRAVGMKRRQVRKIVLAQALTVGLVALLPGTVLGLLMAYGMSVTTYRLQGHAVPFQVDVPLVAGCILVALAFTVLAAWFPARRAGKLRIIEALQYE